MIGKRSREQDLDKLLADSQRLRDELLKTVAKLETFADLLTDQVEELKEATEGSGDRDGDDGA